MSTTKAPTAAALRAAEALCEEFPARICVRAGEIAAIIDAEIAPLVEALRADALFLRRFLELLHSVPVADERGHIVNSFAAALVPDWELKQRLEDIDAALGTGTDPAWCYSCDRPKHDCACEGEAAP